MPTPSPHRRVIAYLDCCSGISGDMLLAALVSAGLPLETLTDTLRQVDLEGYRIITGAGGPHAPIAGTRLQVQVDGHPPPRDWQDIRLLLTNSRLSDAVKARALAIFTVLAEAEAKVHGCPVEEVHFHEVGAVDSIVDIVGAAIGLEALGIDQVVSSPLPLAKGWVRTAHGVLPLPAPAVCELLVGVPVYGVELGPPSPPGAVHSSLDGASVPSQPDRWGLELVTPTGAAIVKACAQGFGPLPTMTITRVGYGLGSKERPDGRPNLLRVIIGEARTVAEAQQVTIIETNLDDWSPETFPFLSERLFAAGALDVTLIPIQMKKGRPGFTIQVMAPPLAAFLLQQVLLTETSAIGLRFRQEERLTLPRSLGAIPTRLGMVRAKRIETPAGMRVTPEYEACRRLALERGLPISEIYRAVAAQPADLFQPDE